MSSLINDPKNKKIIEVIIFEITKKNAIMYKKEIGKGGFSKVYEVTYKGYILVCKMQILKEKEPTTNVKKNNIENEMNLITKINHINIIKTLFIFKNEVTLKVKKKIKKDKSYQIKDEKETYLVYNILMEKASYFDLAVFGFYFHKSYLLRPSNKRENIKYLNNLSQILIFNFIQQILSGIYYLKQYNYVTFDLKPENIVLTNNLILKLIDFSLMGKINENNSVGEENNSFSLSFKSTFSIMGPEYYDDNKKKISNKNLEKIEIFSLGCIIYFLIFNKNIYDNKYKNDIGFNKNKNIEILEESKKKLKENKYYDKELIDFIENCLKQNIEERLSIKNCFENEFIYKTNKKYKKIMNHNYNEKTKIFIEFQKIDQLKKIKKHKRFKFKKLKNIN